MTLAMLATSNGCLISLKFYTFYKSESGFIYALDINTWMIYRCEYENFFLHSLEGKQTFLRWLLSDKQL